MREMLVGEEVCEGDVVGGKEGGEVGLLARN